MTAVKIRSPITELAVCLMGGLLPPERCIWALPGVCFFGVISGINHKGLFIQLDDILVDGFISLKSISDDYYIYEPTKYILRGRRYKKEYHIGDAIEIKIVNVNILLGIADFEMVN